ncbi:hypothetical protein ACROYT_G041912 [Oculina patagonica]
MVFPQVIAGFHALVSAIGLPVNLLLIVTIALERRFHVMRYIPLASLAVSDFLFLILGNSFRIASIAKGKWLYGPTMCYVNAFSMRYFYLNTVLHLIAVSYERYSAIVKSPMAYDELFLNWSVLKTANTLQRNPVQARDIGESQNLLEMSRRRRERKAAVDVCIIIAAFMVCYLPFWTVGMCRQFRNSSEVPAEFVFVSNVIYSISALCNPIIYSIRKREYRAGIKNVFRRIGVCESPINPQNNEIGMKDFTSRANCSTGKSSGRQTAAQATQNQGERFYGSTGRSEVTFQKSRLSPIQEITD